MESVKQKSSQPNGDGIMTTTDTLHNIAKAIEVANYLNTEEADAATQDDGAWTYKVVDLKNGLAKINVFDEDGHIVGTI